MIEAYKEAQGDPGSGFDCALRELQAGAKRSHWIWYVFPQLAGLGGSMRVAVLRDPQPRGSRGIPARSVLRSRLLAVTSVVAEQVSEGASLETLMGSSIDALKLVSSLTLFGHAAKLLHAADGLAAYGTLARWPPTSSTPPPCKVTALANTRSAVWAPSASSEGACTVVSQPL